MKQIKIGRYVKLFALIVAGSLLALLAQAQFPLRQFEIWLAWALYFVFVLIGTLLNWYLRPKREETVQKDVIDIFIKIASSVLLVASLAVAWVSLQVTQSVTAENLRLSREALDNNREEMRATRFMNALEKLGGDSLYPRLAGVVAFQKLDQDFMNEEDWNKATSGQEVTTEMAENRARSKDEHRLIRRVLTDFIKIQVPWPGASTNDERTEVLAALKFLSGREQDSGEQSGLNLRNINLRGYNLSRTQKIDCDDPTAPEVHFEYVDFSFGNFEDIHLKCVNLEGAKFKDANLKNARLDFAVLTGADLTGAHLEGAWMRDTICGECETLIDAITDESTMCPSGFMNESGKCVRLTPSPTPSPTPTPIPGNRTP